MISGFLITKIINEAVNAGTFSIVDFYIRRVRRIFPALFAVYAATAIFAIFYCFSFEADFIGKVLMSSVFFVSNVFFRDHIWLYMRIQGIQLQFLLELLRKK